MRDRGIDVIGLAERFLEELALPEPISIADDAKTAIATYDWPGNVRELKNAIRRTAMFCSDNTIRLEDLDLGRPHGWGHKLAKELDDQRKHLDYESLHLLVDRIFLPDVLEEQGSLRACARHLKITRGRLRSRLQVLGLYDSSDS
jgi:DNA-binding NtrC family response regulator